MNYTADVNTSSTQYKCDGAMESQQRMQAGSDAKWAPESTASQFDEREYSTEVIYRHQDSDSWDDKEMAGSSAGRRGIKREWSEEEVCHVGTVTVLVRCL